MAFGLAAYVSRIGFPPTRKAGFQVLVRLSWAGFHPQGSYKRFQIHLMFIFLLLQASWHNHEDNSIATVGCMQAANKAGQ